MEEFLSANWGWIPIIFIVAEKLVKRSKWKADDIILDIVWSGLKQFMRKGK